MDIRVLDPNPLYLNQTYRLRFRFSTNYPIGTSPRSLLDCLVAHTYFIPPTHSHFRFFFFSWHSIETSLITSPNVILNTEAPEVTFMISSERAVPIHPHIYSNGIICLDLLDTQGWSPVQNVSSVCMSIQSMLTGNTKDERPPGDEDFVRRNTQRPRDIRFVYDDPTI